MTMNLSVLAKQKKRWIFGLSGLIAAMLALVAYSPELYRIFCDVTGYGGGTQRVATQGQITSVASNNTNGLLSPEVTVYFDANTDKRLPWQFVPEQRKVTVRVGETRQIFYRARNLSSETIVGQATFNVTPFQAGSYFFKAECFCFSEQLLKPQQEARMPVVFYIEEDMLEDNETQDIRDITLSYTFYRLKDLETDGVEMNHSEHMQKDDGNEHNSHRIDNLHETGKKRQESLENDEEQNFTPAGVRKI